MKRRDYNGRTHRVIAAAKKKQAKKQKIQLAESAKRSPEGNFDKFSLS